MLVIVTIIVAAVIKIINIKKKKKKSKRFLEEDNIKKYGTKGDFFVWFCDDEHEGYELSGPAEAKPCMSAA